MQNEPMRVKTILVVEDDKDIRNLYVEILNGEGFKVFAAESGEEALRLLGDMTRDPCLVVTDFMMPGMSGTELVKILREDDLLISVPVVMISAKPLADVDTEGVDFLKKPIDVETIIEKVKEYCGSPFEACSEGAKKKVFDRENSSPHH